jgi:hypothetical protein
MKRMNSRYAGKCGDCKRRFPAGALIDYDKGAPRGLKAFHADCDNPDEGAKEPAPATARENPNRVIEIRTASGTFYQRAGGRCEDAPCCGCCTC